MKRQIIGFFFFIYIFALNKRRVVLFPFWQTRQITYEIKIVFAVYRRDGDANHSNANKRCRYLYNCFHLRSRRFEQFRVSRTRNVRRQYDFIFIRYFH